MTSKPEAHIHSIDVYEDQTPCGECYSREEYISKLEAVANMAEELETHPAFCIGTRSCEALPQGIMGRIKTLREALSALDLPKSGGDGPYGPDLEPREMETEDY